MARNPNQWRRNVNEYFTFSKGQRRAVIILSTVIGLSVFLPAINNYLLKTVTEKADPVLIEQVAKLKVYSDSGYKNQPAENTDFAEYAKPSATDLNETQAAFFIFDPNTATTEAWQKLGLRDKTIQTIQKYLSKGGHFYKAEDLKKIYGLREKDVDRLIPYVRIAKAESNNQHYETSKPANTYTNSRPAYTLQVIDINTADTTAYKSLPGIGSKLAARIVNFRAKLGGFYKIEQVGETFGVADSTFQKIKPLLTVKAPNLTKRNINTAAADDLRMPYIPFNVANAIVQYRTHNGNFSSVDDLKKIPLIDDALFVKISPYLTVD
ncbi:helix-hairpin-helix domain-containing protein [soil metagenome]